MKSIAALSIATLCTTSAAAQQNVVETAPITDNWHVQLALDMTLQNPYGQSFRHTLPNGRAHGFVVAAGRWFTPHIGLRLRANWENGCPIFENHHANWLAPFYQPGVNMDRGGFLSVVGDIQLDIHNLCTTYDPNRRWHTQIFPRAGLVYNFGVTKGSPLIGIGLGNTYTLTPRLNLFLDIAYQYVSSGFNAQNTGTGSHANAYLDTTLGVQINLAKHGFKPLQR